MRRMCKYDEFPAHIISFEIYMKRLFSGIFYRTNSFREMRWMFLDQFFMFDILVMMIKRATLAKVRPEDRN